MAALTIFNIQRMAMHDGPGIRTTVFLKGCNLACAWCHNPESQSSAPQLLWEADRCIGCGICARTCQTYRRRIGPPDRERCTLCGLCVQQCPTEALRLAGESWPVQALLTEVLKDEALFRLSGGGITFSGGEPMLQREALAEALTGCKSRNVHTAVDTAGNVPWDWFEQLMPYTDLFLYDLKLMDPVRHRRYTSVDNQLILANLQRLSLAARAFVRIPLIADVNVEEIEAMASFLRECSGVEQVELLPYHTLGSKKYQQLERETPGFQAPTPSQMDHCKRVLENAGIPTLS